MQPEITPEELENRTFTTKMRGYDPEEVDSLLAAVADQMRGLRVSADRAYQAVGEEMGELLQGARDRADTMVAEAERQASETVAQAQAQAEKELSEARAEAERLRSEAQQEAAEMRSRAEADAAETRSSADEDAARVRLDADETAAETRLAAERDADRRINAADERVRRLEEKESNARERIALLRGELLRLTSDLELLETPPVTTADAADLPEEAVLDDEVVVAATSERASEPTS